MTGRSGIPGGLTVVMPLYNKGAHIDRAIQSVLSQIGGFEALIIVDDGSSDDGPDRVATYQDPRIRLLRRSPPGPGGYAARNLAIEQASTRWIAFLDADDAWKPGFTAAIERLLQRNPEIGCAFTAYEMIDPSGEVRLSRTGQRGDQAEARTMSFDAFLRRWIADGDCPLWTGSTCFRRDVLLDAGLFPAGRCRRGGDKDLWLRAMALTTSAYDPHPFVSYFRDSENMVTSTVKTHAAHCIVHTVDRMVARDEGRYRPLLQALSNLETFNYSVSAARSGGLNPSIYARFHHRYRDYRFYLIQALARTPDGLRRRFAKIIQRIFKIGR